jgi:hypothetical protein
MAVEVPSGELKRPILCFTSRDSPGERGGRPADKEAWPRCRRRSRDARKEEVRLRTQQERKWRRRVAWSLV